MFSNTNDSSSFVLVLRRDLSIVLLSDIHFGRVLDVGFFGFICV